MAGKDAGTIGILALLGIAGGVGAVMLLSKQGEPAHGALRGEYTCWDGSKRYTEIYSRITKSWNLCTEVDDARCAACPALPADGDPDPTSAVTCPPGQSGSITGRNPFYSRVWSSSAQAYVETGEVCEWNDGAVGTPASCPGGGTVYLQIYSRLSHSWIPYQSLEDCGVAPASCIDPNTASGVTICRNGTYQTCEDGVWADSEASCAEAGCSSPYGPVGAEYCDGGVSKVCTPSGWVPGGNACPVTACVSPPGDIDDTWCDNGVSKVCTPSGWTPGGSACVISCADPAGVIGDEYCDAGISKICTSSGWVQGGSGCLPSAIAVSSPASPSVSYLQGGVVPFTFTVTSGGVGLGQAVVGIYVNGALVATVTTNANGSATYNIDTTPYGSSFNFRAEFLGYQYCGQPTCPLTHLKASTATYSATLYVPATCVYNGTTYNVGDTLCYGDYYHTCGSDGNWVTDGYCGPVVYDYVIQGTSVYNYDGTLAYTAATFTDALKWAAATAKITYIPAGTYEVTRSVSVATGASIIGDGPDEAGTVLNFSNPDRYYAGFWLADCDNVRLSGLRLTGNGYVFFRNTGVATHGNYIIEDVTSYRLTGNAMGAFAAYVTAPGVIDGIAFTRCHAIYPGTHGFLLGGNSLDRTLAGTVRNVTFTDCTAEGCGVTARTEYYANGWSLAQGVNVANVQFLRCNSSGNYSNGYSASSAMNATGVVFDSCDASNNGVAASHAAGGCGGWDYSPQSPYLHSFAFTNCTGYGNWAGDVVTYTLGAWTILQDFPPTG